MGTGMKVTRKRKPVKKAPPRPSGLAKQILTIGRSAAQIAASQTAAVRAARAPQPNPFTDLAGAIRGAEGASAGSDGAAAALDAQLQREALAQAERLQREAQAQQAQLTRESLAEQRRQFEEDLGFRRAQQQFAEKNTMTQRLLEAAGLATSPTGAIQLAYMARGQGAPVEQIRSVFQNLPFIQALLQGKTLPGFGLPEQLGAATARVTENALAGGMATQGKTFGTVLPSALGVTEMQFMGLTGQEQQFLGALHTAETGESGELFFQKMLKGFIPTTSSVGTLAS